MKLLGLLGALGVAFTAGMVACGGDDTTPGTTPGDDGGPSPTTDGGDPTNPDATPPDPTPGCGDPNVKKGFVGSQSITAGGSARTYELFVPDTYDGKKSYPLIFVFHGDGGDGAGIRSSFKLEAEAANGAIFVYPDGQNTTWSIDTKSGLASDVGFIDGVVASLAKTHCTDKSRIFAVGFSRGAYFANMLACLSTSKLRAVVAHSGGGPFGIDGSGTTFDGSGNLVCPAGPVAAMQIIGSNDGLLNDAQDARKYWLRVNTCGSSTTPFDPSPCTSYSGCNAARPEVYCEIPGMGHQIWSSAPKAIWGFLKTK